MKKVVWTLFAVCLLCATQGSAQTSTVTLPSGDSYMVHTTGSYTSVTKLEGCYVWAFTSYGDPRLHDWAIEDPDSALLVRCPVVLTPPSPNYNSWPTVGGKPGAPVYPLELYMQLYPSLFPSPTVEQARVGTDLVWKYHPKTKYLDWSGVVEVAMSLSQFQQYQTREIDRAVFNEKINEKMRQCEQGAKSAKQCERDAKKEQHDAWKKRLLDEQKQRQQAAKNAKKRR
jgi:hypothetical protein